MSDVDTVLKAIDHYGRDITQSLSHAVGQYGPQAFDILVQVKQASCIAIVASALLWGLFYFFGSVSSAWWLFKCTNSADWDGDGPENMYAVGQVVFCILIPIFLIASIVASWPATDPWNWIGIFNPKVAVFHDVIQKVLGQ